MDIRKAFDDAALLYDGQRKYVIPEFRAFYEAAVWAAEWPGVKPKILDIGAGTGLLTALLLEKYPEASVTLIDFSEQMLDLARKRFSGKPGTRYIVGDYSREDLGGRYDLICSALSIHHLTHEDKKRLYRKIYNSLYPGGIFVNAEQVLGESARLQQQFMEYWDSFLQESPLPAEEMTRIRNRRAALDREERLSVQLDWLRNCGFTDVDIVYKNRMFVVFTGRKE